MSYHATGLPNWLNKIGSAVEAGAKGVAQGVTPELEAFANQMLPGVEARLQPIVQKGVAQGIHDAFIEQTNKFLLIAALGIGALVILRRR